jgi:hypothetical protein
MRVSDPNRHNKHRRREIGELVLCQVPVLSKRRGNRRGEFVVSGVGGDDAKMTNGIQATKKVTRRGMKRIVSIRVNLCDRA